ncbi:MAG: hypothetical protein BMS9Abin39_0090 [Ignavibacteria bacterium]|nr:MAG: hypothetical protein BMS9Abin39_0090 [Ignavibacteria bacterium]
MSTNIFRKIKLAAIILAPLLFIAFSSSGDENKGKLNKPGDHVADAYTLRINRIILPLNSRGILANVAVGTDPEGGFFDGKGFLFSGGFLMSGKIGAVMWSNGNASASRIEDYLPGTSQGWIDDENDPRFRLYVVNSKDDPFGESWQEWKDAVDLGAYFYDGNGDGVYDPTDKNGNGEWDPDEDMPDLLGDETVWTVYTDALDASLRRFSDQDPVGVEVRQTVWGFAQAGDLGNIVFLRFSLNNAGTVADVLDSVYFGVWADPDLGDFNDDLVGSDTTLNSGYVYNDGADNDYGSDPPAFLIDFFQGPWEATGNPDDIAFNAKGPLLGIDSIAGALNLPMTSFIHYMQSHPTQGDPDNITQARNYLTGRNQPGEFIDPCNWAFGVVVGEDCSLIDGKFMYSGDPPANKGWINTAPFDQRQMSNTGPFTLKKNEPVDIVVAYVVGRGNSALQSISVAKTIDRQAQFIFASNFNLPPAPPAITPTVKTTDNSIELIWETADQFNYFEEGAAFKFGVEGINVFMHQTNSLSEFEGGAKNTVLLQSYDLANDIQSVVIDDPLSLESRTLFPEGGIQLDSAIYMDPIKGRISLTINIDPFTGSPLIKGKPYFISIIPVALNFIDLEFIPASPGFYRIPFTAAVGALAPVQVILSDGVSPVGIVPGKDTYTPFPSGVDADHIQGSSEAIVNYDVKDRFLVNDHDYEVSFLLDSSQALYDLYYFITDLTTGVVELDSSKQYNGGLINDLIGGAVFNVEWVEPGISSAGNYSLGSSSWFVNDTIPNRVGTWYMGKDVVDPLGFPSAINASNKSKITLAPDMKNVELRFGQTGKAYRYMRKFTYKFAGDSGFVDVPFQAWAVDKTSGTEFQLAVGFTESALSSDTLANPDGIYDPGTDVFGSREYIIIFNSPYDPTGNAYAYTGNSSSWANLGGGYNLNSGDPRFNDSLKTIAKSPYFDAIYVAGIQRAVGQETAEMTGIYSINVSTPLTAEDKYRINVNIDITADTEKDLFNKINVFPNPLFAYNPGVGFTGGSPDAPYVTFSNLPTEINIRIFTISGNLIRTLVKNNNDPYMTWDLLNENGLRVASGMYLAIVSNAEFGQRVLKFAIIMPQKQIRRF